MQKHPSLLLRIVGGVRSNYNGINKGPGCFKWGEIFEILLYRTVSVNSYVGAPKKKNCFYLVFVCFSEYLGNLGGESGVSC